MTKVFLGFDICSCLCWVCVLFFGFVALSGSQVSGRCGISGPEDGLGGKTESSCDKELGEFGPHQKLELPGSRGVVGGEAPASRLSQGKE